MTTYKLANNVYTTLTNAISHTDDVIVVNKASYPFKSPPELSSGETGILTIVDSTRDPSKIEIIAYSAWYDNEDGTINLEGCTRGEEDTTEKSFASGSTVIQSITNSVVNYLKDISAGSIDDLSDVNIEDASNRDVLTYNSSTSTWQASAVSGSDALSDLSDVDADSPSNDDMLVYSSSTEKWESTDMGFGNCAERDYYIDTSDPTGEQGQDGDVWYVIESGGGGE